MVEGLEHPDGGVACRQHSDESVAKPSGQGLWRGSASAAELLQAAPCDREVALGRDGSHPRPRVGVERGSAPRARDAPLRDSAARSLGCHRDSRLDRSGRSAPSGQSLSDVSAELAAASHRLRLAGHLPEGLPAPEVVARPRDGPPALATSSMRASASRVVQRAAATESWSWSNRRSAARGDRLWSSTRAARSMSARRVEGREVRCPARVPAPRAPRRGGRTRSRSPPWASLRSGSSRNATSP